MKSIHKSNFFNDSDFDKIKESVYAKINDEFGLAYAEDCTRSYRITFLPINVQDLLLDRAKQETGDDSIQILYNQIVKYQIKDGVSPKLKRHKDVAVGEWVMDIVLDSTIDWPIVIEDQSFSNTTNSVTFIRGEEEPHWRPDFPSEDQEDFVLLLFVHLANKGSNHAKISRQVLEMGEAKADSFLRSVVPSWGKKYNV
jgi:hypothetical protein